MNRTDAEAIDRRPVVSWQVIRDGFNARMQEILEILLELARAGRSFACCRLIETRGSTPQKAGAMMLVLPDGSQAGTLGGGCVEAEVKRRALAVIETAEAELARFELDNDYGWDDGLICGGRMQILIEPFFGDALPEYFEQLGRCVLAGKGGTEAIVYGEQANGLKASSAFLLNENGRVVATLRTGSDPSDLPEIIAKDLRDPADRPRAYAARGVAFLPVLPRCRLLIVGGGHVGKAVADLAVPLDFDVWIVDDRAEYVSAERFPLAKRRIAGRIAEVLADLEITADTYCLIVTRGHNHDEQALFHLADRGACYVGMIGSRRKIRMIFDDLSNQGMSQQALSRVYAPLGIDIGSQTVAEIAVSICAELVSHRNRGGVVPGRLSEVMEGLLS